MLDKLETEPNLGIAEQVSRLSCATCMPGPSHTFFGRGARFAAPNALLAMPRSVELSLERLGTAQSQEPWRESGAIANLLFEVAAASILLRTLAGQVRHASFNPAQGSIGGRLASVR